MSDDEEMERLQADIDQIIANAKPVDPLAACSAEEVEDMLKELDAGNERHITQNIHEPLRLYKLKHDRAQLIGLLERAHALAATMDEPDVTSSVQDLLIRVREESGI